MDLLATHPPSTDQRLGRPLLLRTRGHQPLRMVNEPWRTYLALMGAGVAIQLLGLLVTQISRPVGGVILLAGALASIYGVVTLIRYMREEA